MNRATRFAQEMALAVARHPQAEQVPSAVNKPSLEIVRGESQELGHADQVGFGQVDEPLLLAAVSATALALEANAGHGPYGSARNPRYAPNRLETP